ncbi:unnamed protein product [Adineta ricciae]|uniref:Peptidase C14 caspase domain-containing protein n=1 Tax=Adineta ricciae TaxID=249248 RepID=A0A814UZY9_ADIRI|nr:unnamed protein product [Adineta ricciae]CAF1182400.1 unnamed protein product [Adineta ricciae]
MFQRQALVIGNGNYKALPRKPCVNDANDMSAALRSIGFLTHCATDLNSYELERRTNRFAQSIEPNSLVVFYYSGLGVQYNDYNYLIPTDNAGINAESIKEDAVNVENFIETLQNKAPRVVIVILDCCRPYRALGRLNPFFDRNTLGLLQGLAPVRPPPSTVIAYSSAEGTPSTRLIVKGRNSIFTHHLLRHITTPNVDIDTILKLVSWSVQQETRNQQIPIRYSNVYENICLVNTGFNQNYLQWPYGMQLKQPIGEYERLSTKTYAGLCSSSSSSSFT